MQVLKEDLLFTHYYWEVPAVNIEDLIASPPSRKNFDPFNGRQVLSMINYFLAETGRQYANDAKVAESLLMRQLPDKIRSERSVYAWLATQEFQ